MLGHRDGTAREGTTGGARTLGRYWLVAELARGGMGVIYLALMRGPGSFNKLLVLKELRHELLDDPAIVAMFMEEARLAACLSHLNVVQTVEAGREGNRHYIAMEYLEGQSLYRVLAHARKGGMSVPFELQGAAFCAALDGLAYAHAATDYQGKSLGIVHRDMSPHNIFLGYDGQVKLLDFGIAKAMTSPVDTRTELLKGKIAYMAPEQAAGSHVDARTDLFSMGVMLWEAATGRRFWSEVGGDMQILRGLLRGDLDSARARAIAAAPEDLRDVIGRATAFEPSLRYGSAPELLADVRAVLTKREVQVWGSQEIGSFVHQLFAEDRARLQSVIENALRICASSPTGQTDLGARAASRAPSVAGASTPSDEVNPLSVPILWDTTSAGSSPTKGSAPASATVAALAGVDKSIPRVAGRIVWTGGAAAVLATIAAVAGLPMLRRPAAPVRAVSGSRETTSAGAAPLQSAVPVEKVARVEKVHVIIRASPANVRIIIDRNLVVDNPTVLTLPRDDASHSVHVEADGYVPRDDSFDANGDATLIIALEPYKTTARAGLNPQPTAPHTSTPVAEASEAPSATASGAATATQTGGIPQRRINATNPYAH